LAQTSGYYEADVTVDAVSIEGSPFKTNVQPRNDLLYKKYLLVRVN
jgi:hypothetical protein